MLWQLFFVLLILWVTISRWKARKFYAAIAKLPSVKYKSSLPFVGQICVLLGNDQSRIGLIKSMGKKTTAVGGISTFSMGIIFVTVITDAEAASVILRTCLDKSDLMINDLTGLLGQGILIAKTTIWKPRRKLMNPSFAPKNLNQFSDVFSKYTMELIHNIEPHVGKGDFALWPFLHTFTMDVVFETNLGIKVFAQKNPENSFLKAFDEGAALLSQRIITGILPSYLFKLTKNYRNFMDVIKILHTFIGEAVQKKKEELEKRPQNNNNMINGEHHEFTPLLESLMFAHDCQLPYSEEELGQELLLVALAGTDTSAVGACYTLRMLAKYPDVQKKVYTEIRDVIGDQFRPPTTKELSRLQYLDAVIKESIRLYPPIPMIIRKIDKPITLPSGVTLFPGMDPVINIYAIHRNPRYWGPDADKFRPDRFFDPTPPAPGAFVGFSYGSRNCIGYQYAMLSMKTVVSSLLQKFHLLPPLVDEAVGDPDLMLKDPDIEDNAFKARYDIMMKDCNNYKIRMEKRQ